MPVSSLFKACWQRTAPIRTVSFAVALLIALALAVVLGVVFPQEAQTPMAEIRQRFGAATPLWRAMGLFSVYSAPWFLLLQALLFASLLLGSFQWLKPAFLAATRALFLPAATLWHHPQALWLNTSRITPASAAQVLGAQGYRVHLQRPPDSAPDAWRLYASRGHLTRLGPALAHLGVLLLLGASAYGAFTGLTAHKLLTPGTAFWLPTQADALLPTMAPPFWQGRVPPWRVTLSAFDIRYHPTASNTAQQYESTLTITDAQGRRIAHGVSAVNRPLRVGGVAIYQAGFEPTGRLNLTINGTPRVAEVSHRLLGRPVALTPLEANDATNGAMAALAIFPALKQEAPDAPLTPDPTRVQWLAISAQGDVQSTASPTGSPPVLAVGDVMTVGSATVRYDGPQWASALRIQHAPEAPLMFVAFGVIALGSLLCVFAQRQLWLAHGPDGRVWLLMASNKPWLTLARDRQALITALSTIRETA